jgi:CheY-like chemotaxis protein
MPPRILIVDDDHTLADVLSVALRRAGYDARVAYDGQRALQILHQEPFDLVAARCHHAQHGRIEVCKRIRSDPQISHVLVLLFTALTLRAEMRDARKSGADGFITSQPWCARCVCAFRRCWRRGQTGRETLGPIVAFIGVKGGVGASTVALNVALGLVSEGYRTLLLDWAVQDSPPVGHMGLEPTHFLLDLANAKAMSITIPDLQNCTLTM